MMRLRLSALFLGLLLLLPAVVRAQALPTFDQTRIYAQEADFQRAIQPYQAAISADGRNARAHYWLGFAYLYAYRQYRTGVAPYAAGYLPRALTALRQSVQLEGTSVPALLALHDALFLAGLDDEAAEVIRKINDVTRPRGLPYVIPPG